ncbi:hypothetical protein CO2235_200046 [Cupriavidus oxalaticus]|uniref:Uncharacterized protein n=1 Tax=Cupriavidus oxalaticus TaxID=96344 RepID=A0A976BCT7_9BURK|nr:hypothetical protein CO2235_200046 [Cupriavidus oxalaticus]
MLYLVKNKNNDSHYFWLFVTSLILSCTHHSRARKRSPGLASQTLTPRLQQQKTYNFPHPDLLIFLPGRR